MATNNNLPISRLIKAEVILSPLAAQAQSLSDLLILGSKEQINRDLVVKIMNKVGKEIQLNVLSMIKWEKMKKENDAFAMSVIKNHVLIKGVEL